MTKNSETQHNLLRAFAGESMARNKYTQFARKENLEWIARVFEKTADNERTHASELFEQIKGIVSAPMTLEIKAYTSNTIENLKMAVEGEHYEWTHMYPDFEKVAIAEKENEAVRLFGNLKKVEEKHEERYIILAKKLDDHTLYNADAELE